MLLWLAQLIFIPLYIAHLLHSKNKIKKFIGVLMIFGYVFLELFIMGIAMNPK